MFSFLFGTDQKRDIWRLVPRKYEKDSKNNYTSKVMLPYSIFVELCTYNYMTPYVFEISNSSGVLNTVCTVLDFALETNEIYMPEWMYEQLCLNPQEHVILKYTKLRNGTGIKLLPHKIEFLELEDVKSELEKGLSNYLALSCGDDIVMEFLDIGTCRFTVKEVEPGDCNSIYIADVDLNVDFEEPKGYQEYLERERTILKNVRSMHLSGGITKVKLDGIGLFLDWSALEKPGAADPRVNSSL